jgi:putative hemolysin
MSWMKTSSILLVLVIAVVMMTAGCTSNQPVTTPVTTVATPVPTTIVAVPTTSGSTGLANPASVYCGQVGGKTEIKKDATGAEYGMCTFPNGSSCEEWALYRGECQPTASGSSGSSLAADAKTAINTTVTNLTNKTPVANLTADAKTAVNNTVTNLTSDIKTAVNNTTVKK